MNMDFGLTKRVRRCRRFVVVALAMLLAVSAGCGKVPTWSELTGQQPPPAPPSLPVAPVVTVPVEAPSTQPAVMPPTVSKPDAAQVITRFKALPPGQVTDAAIIELTALTEGLDAITEINATSGSITDAGLDHLKKLPALKHLGLTGTLVTNAGMQSLQQVSSLESLTLHGPQISAEGFSKLTALPNLKTLDLGIYPPNIEAVSAIGKFPALETILINSVVNDSILELLCECRTLKVLNLNGSTGITDDGLMALQKLESVEELHLRGNHLTGVGLGKLFKLGRLNNLRVLNLDLAPLNEPGIKAINLLRSLESLSISEVPGMNDVGLVEIVSGMRKLKHLNISKCKGIYGQKGFAALKGATDLESIVAFDTNVSDAALVQLKSHKKLKSLNVNANSSCSLSGVQGLKKALPNCEILYAGQKY